MRHIAVTQIPKIFQWQSLYILLHEDRITLTVCTGKNGVGFYLKTRK